jgi:hypothetical protein
VTVAEDPISKRGFQNFHAYMMPAVSGFVEFGVPSVDRCPYECVGTMNSLYEVVRSTRRSGERESKDWRMMLLGWTVVSRSEAAS